MRLTLVRHGQSQRGSTRVVGGHRGCMGLTPSGVVQMRKVGKELYKHSLVPDLIFCSTMRRSKQSAFVVGGVVGSPVVPPTCLLCEIHPGATDSLSYEDLGGYGVRFDEDHPIGSGGESIKDLRLRTLSLVKLLAKDYETNHLALITHFGVVDSFAKLFLSSQVGDQADLWFSEGRAITVDGSPSRGFNVFRFI